MSNELPFLGINPPEVYQAAQRVVHQETPAGQLANRFREELLASESVVTHRQVLSALSDYRELWVAHANRTAGLVRALGDRATLATATIETADHDSGGLMQPVHDTIAGQRSRLSRPVNGGSVIV